MRTRSKLMVLALSALMMLIFTLAVHAQTNFWFVSSTPTNVVQTGIAEVLGEVRIPAANLPYVQQASVASTISVTYNVPITNVFTGTLTDPGTGVLESALGITISLAGNFVEQGVTAQVYNNPANGTGTITISIPAGITPDAFALIKINGVRGRVTGITAPATVNANLTANPSYSHSFVNVSTVIVAYPEPGLSLAIVGANTIQVTEGYAGAFVQYVQGAASGTPAPVVYPRPLYGANANTQIRIQVPGYTVPNWPDMIARSDGSGNSVLRLLSVGGTGHEAVYEYTCVDQGTADLETEQFDIVLATPIAEVSAGLGPLSTDQVPRFEDFLVTAERDPVAEIGAIFSSVQKLGTAGVLRVGQTKALELPLLKAQQALAAGQVGKAIIRLEVFVIEVRALIRGKQLPASDGGALITAARSVIALLRS